LRRLASDADSPDGLLQQRGDVPDARIGISRFWFKAHGHPGTSRQLLRGL
jgi:hypothetical protein